MLKFFHLFLLMTIVIALFHCKASLAARPNVKCQIIDSDGKVLFEGYCLKPLEQDDSRDIDDMWCDFIRFTLNQKKSAKLYQIRGFDIDDLVPDETRKNVYHLTVKYPKRILFRIQGVGEVYTRDIILHKSPNQVVRKESNSVASRIARANAREMHGTRVWLLDVDQLVKWFGERLVHRTQVVKLKQPRLPHPGFPNTPFDKATEHPAMAKLKKEIAEYRAKEREAASAKPSSETKAGQESKPTNSNNSTEQAVAPKREADELSSEPTKSDKTESDEAENPNETNATTGALRSTMGLPLFLALGTILGIAWAKRRKRVAKSE